MGITEFKSESWSSRIWKIKAFFRAIKFAWKYPRHVQIAITEGEDGEFVMNANYAGITDAGFAHVLITLGREVGGMKDTEQAFKDILNSQNGNNE